MTERATPSQLQRRAAVSRRLRRDSAARPGSSASQPLIRSPRSPTASSPSGNDTSRAASAGRSAASARLTSAAPEWSADTGATPAPAAPARRVGRGGPSAPGGPERAAGSGPHAGRGSLGPPQPEPLGKGAGEEEDAAGRHQAAHPLVPEPAGKTDTAGRRRSGGRV